jgi:hypothetical protein
MQTECKGPIAYVRSLKKEQKHKDIVQFIVEHEGTPAQAAHDLMKWMEHEETLGANIQR